MRKKISEHDKKKNEILMSIILLPHSKFVTLRVKLSVWKLIVMNRESEIRNRNEEVNQMVDVVLEMREGDVVEVRGKRLSMLIILFLSDVQMKKNIPSIKTEMFCAKCETPMWSCTDLSTKKRKESLNDSLLTVKFPMKTQ